MILALQLLIILATPVITVGVYLARAMKAPPNQE